VKWQSLNVAKKWKIRKVESLWVVWEWGRLFGRYPSWKTARGVICLWEFADRHVYEF